MKTISIYTIALLSIFFAFCKKKEIPEPQLPPDTIAPTITITTPTTGTSYTTGDTVFINGTVTDNRTLKAVTVKLRYTDREIFVHEHTPGINNNSASISTYHVVTDIESEHYFIMIDADDTAGNHSDMDIKVNVNHHH